MVGHFSQQALSYLRKINAALGRTPQGEGKMIIRTPSFSPVESSFSGLGFFARFKKGWGNTNFFLADDLVITLDDGTDLIFPEGFVTDFASIPRWFWLIPGFSPNGPLLYGAIPHDFGYQHGYFLAVFDKDLNYPAKSLAIRNKYLDKFKNTIPLFIGMNQLFFDNFLEGVVVEKTDARFVASTARRVLRIFGGIAWNNYRKKGPGAYGSNSLDLPGVGINGEVK